MPAPGEEIPIHDAVPCDGTGRPLHLAPRSSFAVSPNMVAFVGGVAVTLLVMYVCTRFGGGRKRD